MRGSLRAIALFVLLVALGCHHDKYGLNKKFREEAIEPPNEKRYSDPDTAPFRKPPPPKDEKSLMGRPGSGGVGIPGAPGGF